MSISVQCPRCNGAVSIADQAAGQRVKCPHCDESFLAPGISVEANDDDDWLNLDEIPLAPSSTPASQPPAPTSQKPPSAKPTGPKPTANPTGGFPPPVPQSTTPQPTAPLTTSPSAGPSTPSFTDDEEALLAEFTDDLDEFTVKMESPPKPLPSAATGSDPLGAGLSPLGGAPTTPSTPKPATSTEYASEYRVKCKLCGTFLYVKAPQAGQTIKCSDCHSPVTIPPPPKVSKKNQVNIADAETFQFEEVSAKSRRGPDPFKRSAEELLEEASREETVSESPKYDDIPSVKDWVLNVFSVFRDLGVVAHWIALSLFAGLPAAIAVSTESSILLLGMFPAGFFISVLVVSCGFAIMHAVANEEETVSDWPTLDPVNWMNQLLVVVAATCLVVVPVWMFCMLILGPTLTSVAMTMFAIFTLFPFVLLSMLDMNSVFIPFSPELARSVSKSQDAWGGFFLSSGLLFAALFFLLLIAKGMGAFGVLIGITAAIGVAFAYFAMIGRLAFAIGQCINAPPREGEVDPPSDEAN